MKVITSTHERVRTKLVANSPSRIIESSATTVTLSVPTIGAGKDLLITFTRLELEEALKVLINLEDL